jgi:hypothetical protein
MQSYSPTHSLFHAQKMKSCKSIYRPTHPHSYLSTTYPSNYPSIHPSHLPIHPAKSMEQSLLKKQVTLRSASQQIPDLLETPKVHYRLHRSLSQTRILNQINPIHNLHPISLITIVILSFHLRPRVPRSLFPSGFPTKILYALLSSH